MKTSLRLFNYAPFSLFFVDSNPHIFHLIYLMPPLDFVDGWLSVYSAVEVHISALSYRVLIQGLAEFYLRLRFIWKPTGIANLTLYLNLYDAGYVIPWNCTLFPFVTKKKDDSGRFEIYIIIRVSLQCILRIHSSSIGSISIIGFSARHDKCLPASIFVGLNDKTLVVVFPSLDIYAFFSFDTIFN